MKIGDLVKMAHPGWDNVGVIIKQIPGWAEYQTILWDDGTRSSIEKKQLEIVK